MTHILKIRETGRTVIAALDRPKFDLEATDRLRAELEPLYTDAAKRPLLLDLSSVEFLPSATLGVLVELANRCRESGRPLALIRLQPKIHQLLKICALDQLFTIQPDETEALAAL